MGVITKQAAVNHMLLLAGESTVSSLTNDAGIDTTTAVFILDQVIQDYLLRGTVGNRTVVKVKLATEGTIELGNVGNYPIMSAELISFHTNDDQMMIQANIRGIDGTSVPLLWNITDNKSTWKEGTEYVLEKILQLPWEDVDTPYQRAMMSTAARQYQLIMQGDADIDKYLANAESVHMSKAKAANADDKRRHIFDQITGLSRDAISRQGYGNDTSRFRFWKTSSQ
jgi:hypothetical protein